MRSLVEWETYLRSYFRHHLQLIGEIPLRRRDVEELADLIRAYFAEIAEREGMPGATRQLTSRYPHVFAVFLTTFSTFNEQLNYWHTLAERLHIPEGHINNYHWRHIAYDFIKSKNLPVLTKEQVSDQYVSTLRFHGGIPIYSLPDFFAHILLPSVHKLEYAEVSGARALKLILTKIYNVDAAVINFLTYSGELGEAFFQSCRKMAQRYTKDQELTTPEELGLPTYLVEGFYSYMESNQEQSFHLRKPLISFNPYNPPYLRLHLPEEQVPLHFAAGKLFWHIAWDRQDTPIIVTPTLHKKRQDVVIRESILPIPNLPSLIKVSLQKGDGYTTIYPIRRWTIPCFPSTDQPLLVARENGQIVASRQELPSESLLLVFPMEAELRIEGAGRRLETYPALTGSLSGWKAEVWDLTQALSIHLIQDDQEICPSIPIGLAGRSPLLAGTTCQQDDNPNDVPLYTNHAPLLRLPRQPGRSLEDELKQWKIEIRSNGEAAPMIDLEATLAAYKDFIRVSDETYMDFDLSSILGEDATGTYNLNVRSQYEIEAEFRFRIWHSLYILGLDKFIFPTNEGAPSITFNLRLPTGSYCEVQPGANGISIEPDAIVTKITADAECMRVDLDLIKPLDANTHVRVPIHIPLSRLSWKLLVGDTNVEPDWMTRPLQRAVDTILQSPSSSIHLAMHGIHEIMDRVSLLLIDPSEPDDYIQEEKLHIDVIDKDILRLPLNPFRTTLARYTQAPQLELHLFYRAPKFEESKRVPLIYLGRELEISDVTFHEIGELTWHLTWNEPTPLRNRRVVIKSAWQPWQSPWEFQIPDKARGNFIIGHIGLLPSHYQIAFYTAAPNEPPRTSFPEDHAFEIYTCGPDERILQLETLANSGPEQNFRRCFEICCILAELGQPYEVYVNKCLEILKLRKITNLHLLLSYHHWLEIESSIHPKDVGLKANVQASRYWMSAPEIVRIMLQKEKRNNPLRAAFVNLLISARNMYPETAKLLVEHEDDPAVMNSCLNSLMENNAGNSIPLIFDLVLSARLSRRDAAFILAPKWQVILQPLLQLPESNTRNSLIATVLHYVKDPIQAIGELSSDMIRYLLTFDTNTNFYKYYNQILADRKELSVEDSSHAGVVVNPRLSEHEIGKWRRNQTMNLSQITASSRVLTLAGVGKVISICTNKHEEIVQANLRDTDFYLILKLETQETLKLDFHEKSIRFLSGNRVYVCSVCHHFASTSRSQLINHQVEEHPLMRHSMQVLPLEFSIDPRDILILPPK